MSQAIKLNGVAVNAHRPITWGRAGGVDPVIVGLELATDRAEAIFANESYMPLEVNGEQVMVLKAIELRAGSTPFLRTLVLADRRWEWSSKLIVGDFNLRRRTGNSRALGPRVEVFTPVAQVDYAAHSLDGTSVCTPRFMLETVLKQLVGSHYVIDADLPEVNLEDILLNGRGNTELAKALQALPGINVEITETGVTRVYNDANRDTADGKDRRFYAFGDFPVVADRSRTRPALVEVYFVEECELRLNYTCQDLVPRYTDWSVTGVQARLLNLDNVVQVKEPKLHIPVGSKPRSVGYGTWVTMDEYLAALNALPASGRPPASASFFPLTQQVIRSHWLQGFQYIRLSFQLQDGNVDPLWGMRLDSIYAAWRQTFRLAQAWRDRVFAMEAKRTAVYDTVSATRAPSAAYCDYNARPTVRGIGVKDDQSARNDSAWNVTRFTDLNERVDTDSESSTTFPLPSPYEVELIDPEAFIFRLNPRSDPHYEADDIAPGTISKNYLPSVTVNGFNIYKEAQRLLWAFAQLEEAWSMAMVVTAIKGAPNGLGRYRRETVSPGEASKVLKVPVGTCSGPVLQVFVPMQVVTARYAWRDSLSSTIRGSLYDGSRMPFETLVNRDHLRHVAEAVAARAYETFLDTMDGEGPVPYDKSLKPNGPLRKVTHTMKPGVGLYSQLSFEAPGGGLDIWPLLPDATRKALQHIVVRP
jgi:hypothetical protein